jgi:hypothetical protein
METPETPEIKKVKKVKRLTVEEKNYNELIKQDQQGKEALFKYEKEVATELDKLKINKELQNINNNPITQYKTKYIIRTETGEEIIKYI